VIGKGDGCTQFLHENLVAQPLRRAQVAIVLRQTQDEVFVVRNHRQLPVRVFGRQIFLGFDVPQCNLGGKMSFLLTQD
jgi:hypothetical protein